MSFWGGNFAKASTADCQNRGFYWDVADYAEGLATVTVQFDHICVHTTGYISTPPSNEKTYTYEADVEAYDSDSARDEIESLLPEEPTVADLLALLRSM